MTTTIAYKIVAESLFISQLRSQAKFTGTIKDQIDGFIHLSQQHQVRDTAKKWFRGQQDLILIAVDLSKVEGTVKWEQSRRNDIYPHLYGAILVNSIKWVYFLDEEIDGQFVFPPGM